MKRFRLILITENQNSLEKGKQLADLIGQTLECEIQNKISKYDKLKNSYLIEITGKINDTSNSIIESIEMSDKICSPWTLTYDRLENEVELMFNKSDFSLYRNLKFNTLSWATFNIEKK